MTDQIKNSAINKLSVQQGLLMGVVLVVLNIVFRFIDPVLQFTNYWVLGLSFVIVIVLLVVLGLDVRKKTGGFFPFGEAFRCLIIITVVFTLISTTYNFVLIKFVDPELPSKINSAMLDKITTMMTKLGAEQSKIDEGTKQFQNGTFEAKMQPTLKNELVSFGSALLLYAVIDLIIAACIKKKPPVAASAYEDPAV